MKTKPLNQQLEEQYNTLKRLRERILELRSDIEYADKGGKIYYAVDFSEIYSYLQFEDEEVEDIGVSLDGQNPEKASLQHRLGLTHLFNSFADTLYLLPPHTQEMWTYARTQGGRKRPSEDQPDRILERTRSLDPHHKALLESLNDKSRPQEVSIELLEFVKSPEFGPLCVDVSEFVNWYKRSNVLRNLIQDGKLSYQIDRILSEHNIGFAELKDPLRDEVDRIFNKFPRVNRKFRPGTTRIDARALLFLRNINRLLVRANARMVLVTRDMQFLEVAKAVMNESWFGWSQVREYFRGIETVFLDLILHGVKAKSNSVFETDLKLAQMQESVRRILDQVNRSDASRPQFTNLAPAGKKVLEETSHHWDQHINLKLSLASNSVPWLGKNFLEEDLPENFKEFRYEYDQLKNLLEYISTPTYQDLAHKDVQALWSGIEMDCMRISFLHLIGKERATRVSKVLAETFEGSSGSAMTVLRSRKFLRMPSLQFVSRPFQRASKALQVENQEKYDRAFISLITEAMSGMHEPEDFLFMAFVLGMIDEWPEALNMAKKSQQITAEIEPSAMNPVVDPSEVDYFTAIAKRKVAELEDDPINATQGYVEAYSDILRARQAKPEDPRYMKEQAATAMLYHEAVKMVNRWSGMTNRKDFIESQPLLLSEMEAKELYQRALKDTDDLRLKVAILNNLAFAEVLSDTPSFEDAERHLEQIDDFIRVESESQMPLLDGVLPHINDTRVMVRARRAREDKNIEVLNECIEELNAKASKDDLSKTERKTYLSHVTIMKNWLQELTQAA